MQTVSLPKETTEYLKHQVASGQFASINEAIVDVPEKEQHFASHKEVGEER